MIYLTILISYGLYIIASGIYKVTYYKRVRKLKLNPFEMPLHFKVITLIDIIAYAVLIIDFIINDMHDYYLSGRTFHITMALVMLLMMLIYMKMYLPQTIAQFYIKPISQQAKYFHVYSFTRKSKLKRYLKHIHGYEGRCHICGRKIIIEQRMIEEIKEMTRNSNNDNYCVLLCDKDSTPLIFAYINSIGTLNVLKANGQVS